MPHTSLSPRRPSSVAMPSSPLSRSSLASADLDAENSDDEIEGRLLWGQRRTDGEIDGRVLFGQRRTSDASRSPAHPFHFESFAGSPTRQKWTPRKSTGLGSLSTSPTPNTLSLVGSYSESLLSGRMSTTPSQPFAFEADIGVLGKVEGETPRHISVGFDARYYAMPEGSHRPAPAPSANSLASSLPHSGPPTATTSSASNPSSAPYVGVIDLEARYQRQLIGLRDQHNAALGDVGDQQVPMPPAPPSFPGYPVPAHGQVQILVKNPDLKAPVKLFLVPYDLRDMPSGSRTFLRQKVCILEYPHIATRNKRNSLGAEVLKPRETLKYAVHLQFVALTDADVGVRRSGSTQDETPHVRYFLQKSIRVVFSPRPTDKEQITKTYLETPAGMSEQGVALAASSPRQLKYLAVSTTGSAHRARQILGHEWYYLRRQVLHMRKELKEQRRRVEASGRPSLPSSETTAISVPVPSKQTTRADAADADPDASFISIDGSMDDTWSSAGNDDSTSSSYAPLTAAVDIPVGYRRDESPSPVQPNSDPDGERWFDSAAAEDRERTHWDDVSLATALSRLRLSSSSSTSTSVVSTRPTSPLSPTVPHLTSLSKRSRSRTVTSLTTSSPTERSRAGSQSRSRPSSPSCPTLNGSTHRTAISVVDKRFVAGTISHDSHIAASTSLMTRESSHPGQSSVARPSPSRRPVLLRRKTDSVAGGSGGGAGGGVDGHSAT